MPLLAYHAALVPLQVFSARGQNDVVHALMLVLVYPLMLVVIHQAALVPLQVLSTRARKDVKVADIKVQVCLYAFDCLFLTGRRPSTLPSQKNLGSCFMLLPRYVMEHWCCCLMCFACPFILACDVHFRAQCHVCFHIT